MRARRIGVGVGALGLALFGLWALFGPWGLRLELTRGPYVMHPTPTSITIAWETSRPVDGRIDFGAGPGYGSTVNDAEPSARHAVSLTGLAAGTTYAYRVTGGGRVLAEGHTFRTSLADGDAPFTFAVLGDSGRGGAPQYAVAERLKAMRPDLVLHTGDVVYPAGEARRFDDRYFRPYRDLIASIPFFLSLGNHDVATANGQAYLDAFDLPSNNPERTKRYYSFDYGNARFIALDSNQAPGPGGPMFAWLAAELARPPKFWTFVFFHHPPYSSGKHGSQLGVRQVWSPLFERAAVAVVFNGHDHTYERTVPVRDFEPAGPGVVYVVTGGGGGELYNVGRSAWTAHSASVHHVVRVEVRGCALDLQAVATDGAVFDRASIDRCGRGR
jgi:hypothetical protein